MNLSLGIRKQYKALMEKRYIEITMPQKENMALSGRSTRQRQTILIRLKIYMKGMLKILF